MYKFISTALGIVLCSQLVYASANFRCDMALSNYEFLHWLNQPLTILSEAITEMQQINLDKQPLPRQYKKWRMAAFYIQELTRVLLRSKDLSKTTKDHLNWLKDESKFLEDVFGRYNEADELFSFVSEIPEDPVIPRSQLLSQLNIELKTASEEAKQALSKKKWLDNPTLQEAYTKTLKIGKKLEDQASHILIGALVDYIEEVQKNLELPPEKGGYDMSLLEEGLHELRRDLRRIAIVMQAAEGVFSLESESAIPPLLQKLLANKSLLNSPYGQLNYSPKENSAAIMKVAFLALTRDIDLFGQLKDAGQRLHEIHQRLKNLNENEVLQFIIIHPEYKGNHALMNWKDQAMNLQTRILTEGYLTIIISQLKYALNNR